MRVIDEVHNRLAGTPREQRRALNLLKFLTNPLRIPIVCLGTDDALRAMLSEPQVASRFEPVKRPRWGEDETFRRRLAALEATLPLRRPSHRVQKPMVQRILAHSHGITGNGVRLLTRAAVHAILSGQEYIDAALLEAARRPPPVAREHRLEASP